MKIKNIISLVLIFILFLPNFSLAQIDTESIKEKFPGVLEGWWSSTKTFWRKQKDNFFNAFKKAWEEAVNFWKKIVWGWFKNSWDNYVWPKIEWFWEKILSFFKIKS